MIVVRRKVLIIIFTVYACTSIQKSWLGHLVDLFPCQPRNGETITLAMLQPAPSEWSCMLVTKYEYMLVCYKLNFAC